ncbi:MAG TPA: cupin domain-containing protein [Longimicrobiales bacterium]
MPDLHVSSRGEGESLWFLDTLMQVKLAGAATGGALAVFEQLAPAGSATPMHRHDETDEHFYVLEGEVVFHSPAGRKRCVPGTFVSVPRGTEHAFRVADAGPARLLVLSTPGRFEHFVRAVSRSAESATLPPSAPPPTPEQVGALAQIGARHDTTLTGPPPAP